MAKAENLNPPLHILNAEQRRIDTERRQEISGIAATAHAALDAAFDSPLTPSGKRVQKSLRPQPQG